MKKGQTARNRLSHLICPRRFHAEAGFGTWSPVTALAGRGGCRGFIGPVPLPLSIRLTVNIATTRRGVKRFSSPIGELGSENRTNARSATDLKRPEWNNRLKKVRTESLRVAPHISHSGGPSPNHLPASHHITLDMLWSSSPPGDQSITQSEQSR